MTTTKIIMIASNAANEPNTYGSLKTFPADMLSCEFEALVLFVGHATPRHGSAVVAMRWHTASDVGGVAGATMY